MDAYELTRPILSATPVLARRRPPASPAVDALAEAGRYVQQLPLGLTLRRLLTSSTAAREVEAALWALAVAEGVPVSVDEQASALAARLVDARAVVAPAADAVRTLLPLICGGASIEGVRLAELLVAYLEHRTVIAHRFPRRPPVRR